MDVRWPFVSAHTVQCSWRNVWRLDDTRWLTDLSWQDVVGSQLSGSTQRRWFCFDGEVVAVQTWHLMSINGCKRDVAYTVVISQEMPRSATPYTSLINFRLQSNSDWLRGGVKSLIYHTLVITDFHQFKISHSLASCWVVGLEDVMDSSQVKSSQSLIRMSIAHVFWPLIGWPYLPVMIQLSMCMRCGSLVVKSMTITLYNDDVTLFIHYDYIQLLAYVTMAKQVI